MITLENLPEAIDLWNRIGELETLIPFVKAGEEQDLLILYRSIWLAIPEDILEKCLLETKARLMKELTDMTFEGIGSNPHG